MNEFLGFVDLVGRTNEGGYIYRFDFTLDSDVVWGEYFNVTPTGIIPDLQPDRNSLSKSAKAIFPREMVLAKKNYCFSMQDCIDGIIPLIFSELDENTLKINDTTPFFIRFGETMDSVIEKLKSVNIELFDFEEIMKGNSDAIDILIDSMEDVLEDEDDDLNF